MNDKDLAQLINNSNFSEVLTAIQTGEKLPETLQDYHKSQIFDRLLSSEQYEILHHFVKDKTILTDIYEYDKFDQSIFQNIVRNLKTDDKGLAFFETFIAEFDNLNDEVDRQTLLGYFFEHLMPVEVIKVLIDAGCEVNFTTNSEENYIQKVVKNNQRKFSLSDDELLQLKQNYIALLIDAGVDINGQDIVQKTPLISAIEFNKITLVPFLISMGADPNLQDNSGNSAIFYAVAHKQDLKTYLAITEQTSPRLDTLNKAQVTVLFEFTRMINGSPNEILLLTKLIEDGADLYQPSTYYGKLQTPLDLLAEKPATLLEAVLSTGKVDVNQADSSGYTLLHKVCAQNVNYEAEKAKEMYKKVKILIENGAEITLTTDKDETALMLASDDNLKIKTVELLMKANKQ